MVRAAFPVRKLDVNTVYVIIRGDAARLSHTPRLNIGEVAAVPADLITRTGVATAVYKYP
jgi:hypothetical protein